MADIQYARIVGDWRRVVGDEIVSYENTEIGDVGIHGTVTLSPVWARGGPQGISADPGAYYSIHPVVCRVRYGRLYDPTNTHPYEDVAVEIDGQPLVWKAKFDLAFRRRAGEAEVPLQVREVTFDTEAVVAGEIALTGLLPASAIPAEYKAYFTNAALSATVADDAKSTAVQAADTATSAASTASSAAGVADAKAAAAAASVTLAAQEADRAIGLATAQDSAVAATITAGGPTTTALNATYGTKADGPVTPTRGLHVGDTDSTTELQRIIDAAAPGSRKALLPAGDTARARYRITGRLYVDREMTFGGETDMVTVKCDAPDAGITVVNKANPAGFAHRAHLENLLVDGNSIATKPVEFDGVSECWTRNLWVNRAAPGGAALTQTDVAGITHSDLVLGDSTIGIRHRRGPRSISSGYVNIHRHNFWQLDEGVRLEGPVTHWRQLDGWTERVRDLVTVGKLTEEWGTDSPTGVVIGTMVQTGHVVGTVAGVNYTLLRLLATGSSTSLAMFQFEGVFSTPPATGPIIDTTSTPLTAGTNRIRVARGSTITRGETAAALTAHHPSQAWNLISIDLGEPITAVPSNKWYSLPFATGGCWPAPRDWYGSGKPEGQAWSHAASGSIFRDVGTGLAFRMGGAGRVSNTGWVPLGVGGSHPEPLFQSATSVVNVALKYLGFPLYCSTTKRSLWPTGGAATDPWVDAQGVTVYTPA